MPPPDRRSPRWRTQPGDGASGRAAGAQGRGSKESKAGRASKGEGKDGDGKDGDVKDGEGATIVGDTAAPATTGGGHHDRNCCAVHPAPGAGRTSSGQVAGRRCRAAPAWAAPGLGSGASCPLATLVPGLGRRLSRPRSAQGHGTSPSWSWRSRPVRWAGAAVAGADDRCADAALGSAGPRTGNAGPRSCGGDARLRAPTGVVAAGTDALAVALAPLGGLRAARRPSRRLRRTERGVAAGGGGAGGGDLSRWHRSDRYRTRLPRRA